MNNNFLVGGQWAALAPLSHVAAVAAVAYRLRRLGRVLALALAAGIVLGPVAIVWRADHHAFADVCVREAAGAALIRKRAAAEGVLIDFSTANSFGMRYLLQEGFWLIEMRDIRRRDGWVRVERASTGGLTTRPIDEPSARYAVVESFSQPNPGTNLSVVTIIGRAAGRELARAASATFDGGRAKWVLGAWGSDSCPSAYSQPDAFDAYYHLARDTLRREQREGSGAGGNRE